MSHTQINNIRSFGGSKTLQFNAKHFRLEDANKGVFSYFSFGWTSIPSKDPDRGFHKFPITVYHLSFDSPDLDSQKDKYTNIY